MTVRRRRFHNSDRKGGNSGSYRLKIKIFFGSLFTVCVIIVALAVFVYQSPAQEPYTGGGDGEGNGNSGGTDPPELITISAANFEFTPSSINAVMGELVRLEITTVGAEHYHFTIDEFGVDEHLNPNEKNIVEFTPTTLGTVAFYSSIDNHRELGMEGVLIVELA